MADRAIRFDFLGRDVSASRTAERVDRKFTGLSSRFGLFSRVGSRAFGLISTGLGALAVGAAALGLKTAAGLEQAQIAFTQLLGSGKRARSFLADLKKFAAATPFELPGLIDSARGLLGVGVEAKKVIPVLTDLGDAAGALGLDQERFNRVQLAVIQSMAKGKIQAEELMQITEAGIPVWQLLSKALGKPVPELQKLVSQGKLAAADVFPKLFDQMHKDYGGSMAKQSRTLNGIWSTFKDTISNTLSGALQPLLPMLKTALPEAAQLFQDAVAGLQSFIHDTLAPEVRGLHGDWAAIKDDFGALTSSSPGVADGLGNVAFWVKRMGEEFHGIRQIIDFVTTSLLALEVVILDVANGFLFVVEHTVGIFNKGIRESARRAREDIGAMRDDINAKLRDILHRKDIDVRVHDNATATLRRIQAELRATAAAGGPAFSVTARLRRGGTFQHGTMFAPGGLSWLHRGEIVINPQVSERIRRGQAALAAGGAIGATGPITVNAYGSPGMDPRGLARLVRDSVMEVLAERDRRERMGRRV